MEDTPVFSAAARQFMSDNPADQLCFSPLAKLEVLPRPLRTGNTKLQRDYEIFLGSLDKLPITEEVFDLALQLRAKHRLKTPDALHLATAQYHGLSELWTNDDRLNHAAGGMAVNLFAASADNPI
jgi:predicted nucleic acid-binding protein